MANIIILKKRNVNIIQKINDFPYVYILFENNTYLNDSFILNHFPDFIIGNKSNYNILDSISLFDFINDNNINYFKDNFDVEILEIIKLNLVVINNDNNTIFTNQNSSNIEELVIHSTCTINHLILFFIIIFSFLFVILKIATFRLMTEINPETKDVYYWISYLSIIISFIFGLFYALVNYYINNIYIFEIDKNYQLNQVNYKNINIIKENYFLILEFIIIPSAYRSLDILIMKFMKYYKISC